METTTTNIASHHEYEYRYLNCAKLELKLDQHVQVQVNRWHFSELSHMLSQVSINAHAARVRPVINYILCYILFKFLFVFNAQSSIIEDQFNYMSAKRCEMTFYVQLIREKPKNTLRFRDERLSDTLNESRTRSIDFRFIFSFFLVQPLIYTMPSNLIRKCKFVK